MRWTFSPCSQTAVVLRRLRWQWQVDDVEDVRAAYEINLPEEAGVREGGAHGVHGRSGLQHWVC